MVGLFIFGGEKVSALSKKEQIVQEIEEKFDQSKSAVLLDYRGLTVEEVTDLRNKYREKDVYYKVYKNTLVKIALNNKGITVLDDYLIGPNAIAFSMEEATDAAKVSDDFAKENDKLEIKAGLLDGELLTVEGVLKLAKLPSKEELIAKLIGSINSPITNFVMTANNLVQDPLRDLIHVANTLAERMEAGEDKIQAAEKSEESSEDQDQNSGQEAKEDQAEEVKEEENTDQ